MREAVAQPRTNPSQLHVFSASAGVKCACIGSVRNSYRVLCHLHDQKQLLCAFNLSVAHALPNHAQAHFTLTLVHRRIHRSERTSTLVICVSVRSVSVIREGAAVAAAASVARPVAGQTSSGRALSGRLRPSRGRGDEALPFTCSPRLHQLLGGGAAEAPPGRGGGQPLRSLGTQLPWANARTHARSLARSFVRRRPVSAYVAVLWPREITFSRAACELSCSGYEHQAADGGAPGRVRATLELPCAHLRTSCYATLQGVLASWSAELTFATEKVGGWQFAPDAFRQLRNSWRIPVALSSALLPALPTGRFCERVPPGRPCASVSLLLVIGRDQLG